MAVDIVTLAVGGIDRAAAFRPDASVASTKLEQNAGPQFAAQLASAAPANQPANVTSELSAAKKFEAIFVAQMMTSILPEDSEYFGEGFAGDAWRSMMSEQLANVAVKQTDFGIAALIDQGFASQSDFVSVGVNSDSLGTLFEKHGR